jgi:hypothetical protein
MVFVQAGEDYLAKHHYKASRASAVLKGIEPRRFWSPQIFSRAGGHKLEIYTG